MNTVAPPTKMPNDDQPTAIPEINGKVPLKPCCEPCAAQRMLFGPGEKHIAHCLNQKKHKITKSEYSSHLILIGPEGDFSENEISSYGNDI